MGVPPGGGNAVNECEANLVPVNEFVSGIITRSASVAKSEAKRFDAILWSKQGIAGLLSQTGR